MNEDFLDSLNRTFGTFTFTRLVNFSKFKMPKNLSAANPSLRKIAAKKASPASTQAAAPIAPDGLAQSSPKKTKKIFQIYFEPHQLDGLDSKFTPLNNEKYADPLREFSVFERLAERKALLKVSLWGALSWRFGSKTGLTGQAFHQAIDQNPGFDLYYCNPFPEHEALFANGWQQGITAHPAFNELCRAVIEAAGQDTKVLTAIQPSVSFSACNYFVACPEFWASYLPWVRSFVNRARANLPSPVLSVLDSPISDPRNLHAGSTYWPFIIERLLPLYLKSTGQKFKTHRLSLPANEARLNSHLLRLREMKDVAHRTQSPWLYACWQNYRNLYLLQTSGREWSSKYLPLINPVEVVFW